MSNDSPPSPSSVCVPLNQENDDRSELTVTWPCWGDDLSQQDEFGIKLAANPYHYHTLDGSHPSQTEKQELIDLKLQIVRQQDKLDIISSKLSQCEVENEALKVEKAVLVDELAHTHCATQEQPTTRRRSWFPKACDNGGSMQLLIDTNSKLMMDAARLQVMIDVTRKSFQSYIKDSRRGLKTLLRLSSDESTAKTSLGSSFTDENQEDLPHDSYLPHNSSEHSIQDSILRDSLHSIHEQEKFGTSGDDWIIEGENIEANDDGVISERAACERRAARKGAARMNSMIHSMLKESTPSKETKNTFANGATRCKSVDLLVEFGEAESQRPRRTDRRLCHSLIEGTARRKSENLPARTWSSLKL